MLDEEILGTNLSGLINKTDESGRIPLHWAVSKGTGIDNHYRYKIDFFVLYPVLRVRDPDPIGSELFFYSDLGSDPNKGAQYGTGALPNSKNYFLVYQFRKLSFQVKIKN
jgi:hypothetical protein